MDTTLTPDVQAVATAQAAKDAELMAKLDQLAGKPRKVFQVQVAPNRAQRRAPKPPNKARFTTALTDKQRARIGREARILAGIVK